MTDSAYARRLAVCSWSLEPADIDALIARQAETGVARVQLALDPLHESPEKWAGGASGTLSRLNDAGVAVVSGMFGGVGEDYSTLETIRATGGVVPDATWPQLKDKIAPLVDIAGAMGLKLVTFHAGFLPHEESDPTFGPLLERITFIADAFADAGVKLGFETGQETALTLKAFLDVLDKPTVGVNFDPANMILYDKGDPVEAIGVLSPYLVQCHLKDATLTKTKGQWGAEVPVGTGDVRWPSFFKALGEAGFKGDLVIEREAGDQRVTDIVTAREFVTQLG